MEEGGLGYSSSGNGHIKLHHFSLLCFPWGPNLFHAFWPISAETTAAVLCWGLSFRLLARRPTPGTVPLHGDVSLAAGPSWMENCVLWSSTLHPWAINTRCAHKCTANTGQTSKNPVNKQTVSLENMEKQLMLSAGKSFIGGCFPPLQ